jgi:hypothetical protein
MSAFHPKLTPAGRLLISRRQEIPRLLPDTTEQMTRKRRASVGSAGQRFHPRRPTHPRKARA